MTIRGVILIEGADASGKTTLARHLVERYDAKYIHSTVRRDVWKWHLAALRLAHYYSQHGLVVLDRHFLSEQIYGAVYRGGPAYDLGARCFDRVLQSMGALMILAVPTNVEDQINRHVSLKESRKEHFAEIGEVARRYSDLWHGNLARPGDTYLDQLTRFGDYRNRADVVRYDLDWAMSSSRRLPFFVGDQLDWLKKLRTNAEAIGPGFVGSHVTAKYLFLGEAASPQACVKLTPPWPFLWNDSPSAATWLNRALHELAFDERRAIWANAYGQGADLALLHALRPDLIVIAMGRTAESVARKLWRGGKTRFIEHPQWWRRFHHNEPELFLERLKGAMA